jgi:hypothetical protein
MKTKLFLSLAVATVMGATTLAASAGSPAQPVNFRGSAAAPAAPTDRSIVVSDATRHVNVVGGSTVHFVIGDRSFNWFFENGIVSVAPFDLAQIAPAGLLTHPVMVYVSDNPLYRAN